MELLVESDELLQERVAFRVGARSVFEGERTKLQMKFAHPLEDGVVFDVASLDVVGQSVVVVALAALLRVGLGGERDVVLDNRLDLF